MLSYKTYYKENDKMNAINDSITLEEEIRDLIFEKLHIDYMKKEDIKFENPIFSAFDPESVGLGLDSIDVLELVVALRNKYGIEIKDKGLDALKSIKTIADFVRSK